MPGFSVFQRRGNPVQMSSCIRELISLYEWNSGDRSCFGNYVVKTQAVKTQKFIYPSCQGYSLIFLFFLINI